MRSKDNGPTLFDLPSGKTSPESSTRQTTPSAVSWGGLSGQMMPCISQAGESGPTLVWCPGHGHGRLGGFSTLNISDSPNAAAACSLSSILEVGPIPPRFFLSAKACAGILRRAEKRGKVLPQQLAHALRAAADSEQTLISTAD